MDAEHRDKKKAESSAFLGSVNPSLKNGKKQVKRKEGILRI
jgi:hypothetical protein